MDSAGRNTQRFHSPTAPCGGITRRFQEEVSSKPVHSAELFVVIGYQSCVPREATMRWTMQCALEPCSPVTPTDRGQAPATAPPIYRPIGGCGMVRPDAHARHSRQRRADERPPPRRGSARATEQVVLVDRSCRHCHTHQNHWPIGHPSGACRASRLRHLAPPTHRGEARPSHSERRPEPRAARRPPRARRATSAGGLPHHPGAAAMGALRVALGARPGARSQEERRRRSGGRRRPATYAPIP